MSKLKLGLIAAVCASSALMVTGCGPAYYSPGYYGNSGYYYSNQYRRTVPVYPRNYERRYYDRTTPTYYDRVRPSDAGVHPGYGRGSAGGNSYSGSTDGRGGNSYSGSVGGGNQSGGGQHPGYGNGAGGNSYN